MDIAEAKHRLRIPDVWQLLGLPGEPKASCKSPFREDRRASFSVSRGGLLFNDFATGDAGDAVDFLSLAKGLSRAEACKTFIALAGGEAVTPTARPIVAREARQWERPKYPDFAKGNGVDLKRLARLRNLSIEGLQLASERGLLWFAVLRGFDAWLVCDSERVNAQARRMDGGTWEHINGAKAWTLPGSRAAWPIGAREAGAFRSVALVEGGPDLLTACHFIAVEGRERRIAPVAMLGASPSIRAAALPLFCGKRVRIFGHLDANGAGQRATRRWASQLKQSGAMVDAFSFAGLWQVDGSPVGDLNDLARVHGDCYEAESGSLERIMP